MVVSVWCTKSAKKFLNLASTLYPSALFHCTANDYGVEAYTVKVEAFAYLMSKMCIKSLYPRYKIDILRSENGENICSEAVTRVAMSTGIQMTDCEFIRMAY